MRSRKTLLLLLSTLGALLVPAAANAAPSASYTYAPTAPTAGQAVTFNAGGSACDAAPCTYTWSDDGPDGAGGQNWALGTGSTLKFTFQGTGPKYVRLTVANQRGETATTVKTVQVAAAGSNPTPNPEPNPTPTPTPTPTPNPTPTPTPGTGCATTVTSTSAAQSAIASAANGARVCLADGSYGALSISAARSGAATLAAANPGKATLSKVTFTGASRNVVLSGFKVGGIQLQAGSADHQIRDNLIQGSGGVDFASAINPVPGGCCTVSNLPLIQRIVIDGNKFVGPYGEDAMQLKGFKDVTVSNNEITNVTSVNGAHADGVQTVHGGSNLKIIGNYMHDNNMQPIFVGKDGDVSGTLEIRDNLSVRNRVGSSPTQVVSQLYAPHNLVLRNNTLADEGGLIMRWDPSAHGGNNPQSNAPNGLAVDHNVFSAFQPYDDTNSSDRAGIFANKSVMTENYNVIGSGWTWTSHLGSCSTMNAKPAYRDAKTDDYRLSPTACGGYQAGITWRPADRQFGPR
jgi:hypothetical protein